MISYLIVCKQMSSPCPAMLLEVVEDVLLLILLLFFIVFFVVGVGVSVIGVIVTDVMVCVV